MLRKTNSQPASVMLSALTQSTAGHSQYTRMTSDPHCKTLNRLKDEDVDESHAAEKVKGQEVKGQRSGSPQQSKRTLFGGLRSSLSRLSKSPSHEELSHDTSATTDVPAAAAAADAADAAADDDDVKVNCKADRLKAADPGQPQPLTSATDCTPGNYLLLLTSCSLIVQNSPDFYPPTSV